MGSPRRTAVTLPTVDHVDQTALTGDLVVGDAVDRHRHGTKSDPVFL